MNSSVDDTPTVQASHFSKQHEAFRCLPCPFVLKLLCTFTLHVFHLSQIQSDFRRALLHKKRGLFTYVFSRNAEKKLEITVGIITLKNFIFSLLP